MANDKDPEAAGSPADIEDLLETGRDYHRAGNLEAAEDRYWQAISQDHTHPEPYHLLGVIALQSGKLEPARELIQTAQELDPTNPVYHANMGTVHYQAGEREAAETCYRKALELDPDYAEARDNLEVLVNEKNA